MAALAARYGVSNSTVSRLLKTHIPTTEYDQIVAGKRSPREGIPELGEEETLFDRPIGPEDATVGEETLMDGSEDGDDGADGDGAGGQRRVRRRSSVSKVSDPPAKPVTKAQKALTTPPKPEPLSPLQEEAEERAESLLAVASLFDEEVEGVDDLLAEEEDDLAEEEAWTDIPSLVTDLPSEIQPLATATLPRTCYIVVDRFAELVARPLQEFASSGVAESSAVPNTLPVFDNHRVAKRFSNNRNQRVIKVPDSRVFHKATPQLVAKGINLLLVDGQVYSLN
jgi:hypothetical protein